MSRIGKMPVILPKGVEIKLEADNAFTVKGPKGTLTMKLHKDMKISIDQGIINVSRPSEGKMHKSLHGLTRTLISNMVTGVSAGFEKALEIKLRGLLLL